MDKKGATVDELRNPFTVASFTLLS